MSMYLKTQLEYKSSFILSLIAQLMLIIFSSFMVFILMDKFDFMKYALIGCGRVSKNHIKAATLNNLEIVALCDLIPQKAEKLINDNERVTFWSSCSTLTIPPSSLSPMEKPFSTCFNSKIFLKKFIFHQSNKFFFYTIYMTCE